MTEIYIQLIESILRRARLAMMRAVNEKDNKTCNIDSPNCAKTYLSEQQCWICAMQLIIEEINNL